MIKWIVYRDFGTSACSCYQTLFFLPQESLGTKLTLHQTVSLCNPCAWFCCHFIIIYINFSSAAIWNNNYTSLFKIFFFPCPETLPFSHISCRYIEKLVVSTWHCSSVSCTVRITVCWPYVQSDSWQIAWPNIIITVHVGMGHDLWYSMFITWLDRFWSLNTYVSPLWIVIHRGVGGYGIYHTEGLQGTSYDNYR